jgi:hypothetical protein
LPHVLSVRRVPFQVLPPLGSGAARIIAMRGFHGMKVAGVLGLLAVPAAAADGASCSAVRRDLCTVDREGQSEEVSLLALRGKLHSHRLHSSPTKCMRVIHSNYDPRKKMSEPSGEEEFAFEPFRLLGDEEWKDLQLEYEGEILTPNNTDMEWHDARMFAMYELALEVFDKTLPHVTWFVDAGGLLGVWRTGHLFPWDNDIDITVSNKTFNTWDTEERLVEAYGPEVGTSRGNHCEDDGCRMLAVSDDVLLVLHSLPTSESILAKFICRYTGLYIDINADYDAEEVEERAWQNGLRANVPKKPSTRTYLEKYDDLPEIKYWFNFSDTSELYECSCPSDTFEELNTAPSPWELQVMQPCAAGKDESAPWQLAKVDQTADCCRRLEGNYRPGIEISPRWE